MKFSVRVSASNFKTGLKRLALAFIVCALLARVVEAATILQAGRSLSTIVDLVDYSPLAGDETFDFSNDSTLLPAFSDAVATTNVQNDNVGQGTATMAVTLDTGALKFGGSGGSSLSIETHFDAADIASGAMINATASSSYSVVVRIVQAGKLTLSGSLNASGTGQRCQIRVEKFNGSGLALWSRETATGNLDYSAELSLTAGDYLVIVRSLSGIDVFTAGAQGLSGQGNFTLSAQVAETVSGGGKPPKPRK